MSLGKLPCGLTCMKASRACLPLPSSLFSHPHRVLPGLGPETSASSRRAKRCEAQRVHMAKNHSHGPAALVACERAGSLGSQPSHINEVTDTR